MLFGQVSILNASDNSTGCHQHPSSLFPLKQRWASLSPPFRQFGNPGGQRFLRSQLGAPLASEGSCSPSSTSQLTPTQTPFAPNLPTNSCQRPLHARNEHSRTPPVTLSVGSQSCTSPLTSDTHAPPPPTRTYQLIPNMRDKVIQTDASTSPDVPLVEDERRSSTTIRNSNSTAFPNTPPISPCAPACGLYHYPASFYSRPSPPFSSKRRCSSLPPCFRQLKNTRNEHLSIPPSRVAPQIGHKGCMLSLTPHMLYSPPWTNQPSPGMQDEQVPEVPTSLSVLTADSIRSPSSMISCRQFITNSDDNVQLLPTRGQGEEMDEYGHDHWSSSDELNGKSCCRSLGSRASSCGPKISSSFNRSACRHIRAPLSPTSASTSFNNLGRGFPLVASPRHSSGRSSSQPRSSAQAQSIENFVYNEYRQPLPDNDNHTLGA